MSGSHDGRATDNRPGETSTPRPLSVHLASAEAKQPLCGGSTLDRRSALAKWASDGVLPSRSSLSDWQAPSTSSESIEHQASDLSPVDRAALQGMIERQRRFMEERKPAPLAEAVAAVLQAIARRPVSMGPPTTEFLPTPLPRFVRRDP